MNIIIFHDSEQIPSELVTKFTLNTRGLVKSNLSGSSWFSSFVGVIISPDAETALISVPKHFAVTKDIDATHTIIKVLMTYNADIVPNFRGATDAVNDNIPIEDLKVVVDYLNRFGIYASQQFTTRKANGKKILWKKSIQHSNAIYSDDGLILMPLIFRENTHVENIVTEAMRYVLESTRDLLLLLNINPATYTRKNVRKKNSRYEKQLIFKLNEQLMTTHQDKEINLINSLINILKATSTTAPYYLVTTNFDIIWESVVLNYLNFHYEGVRNGNPCFQSSKTQQAQQIFQSQVPFEIDSVHHYSIRPDYYLDSEDVQLIFDAKYYVNLKDLNYKQLIYGILLGDRPSHRHKITVNALFVPTAQKTNTSEIHTKIDAEFLPSTNSQLIHTIYINMNDALTEYVSQ
jgi:hypothetical protein